MPDKSLATGFVVPEEAPAAPVMTVHPAKPTKPVCPHCGVALREEHDSANHLHCDDPRCIGCCFEPGPPVTIRANYPICPAA